MYGLVRVEADNPRVRGYLGQETRLSRALISVRISSQKTDWQREFCKAWEGLLRDMADESNDDGSLSPALCHLATLPTGSSQPRSSWPCWLEGRKDPRTVRGPRHGGESPDASNAASGQMKALPSRPGAAKEQGKQRRRNPECEHDLGSAEQPEGGGGPACRSAQCWCRHREKDLTVNSHRGERSSRRSAQWRIITGEQASCLLDIVRYSCMHEEEGVWASCGKRDERLLDRNKDSQRVG